MIATPVAEIDVQGVIQLGSKNQVNEFSDTVTAVIDFF